VSALYGDNIVSRSEKMPWYTGWGLLETLENIHISSDRNLIDGRFPVQTVIRVNNEDVRDYRACAGQVASGIFRPGDEVVVLPSGIECSIAAIEMAGKAVQEAAPPASVSIILDKEIDVSRGNMIVKKNNRPGITTSIDAIICCLDEKKSIQYNDKLLLRPNTSECRISVEQIIYRIDVNTFSKEHHVPNNLMMNDIARVRLKLSKEMFFDPYKLNRVTGSFILVDEATNNTIAAGLVHSINT
jgi:sulfate adenylyltransferase subunit 1 (EFTu-like GTPase family)